MTNMELVLNMLAETTTTAISQKDQPQTFPENRKVAREGGEIVGNTRKQIEKRLGQPVISTSNFLQTSQQKKIK